MILRGMENEMLDNFIEYRSAWMDMAAYTSMRPHGRVGILVADDEYALMYQRRDKQVRALEMTLFTFLTNLPQPETTQS